MSVSDRRNNQYATCSDERYSHLLQLHIMTSLISPQLTTISALASSMDEHFDYQNKIEFDNESELRSQYGDQFYEEFYNYFENVWFSAIGETIQFMFTPGVLSDAVRHASEKAGVALLDTGNWDGEEFDEENDEEE
ncbi:hypothetical protein [Cyanobium sp. BA20m-p-22]|uniref:hypothetical protein n=1 Tax=Cyanobium sp. BA20m-p-22 TaxID=2823704 RepID=UPI0020CD8F61|nr:hypothetical protein [Cyanobium sp. BA20m-p-22]